MGLSQDVSALTNIFVVNANGTRAFDKLDIAVQEAVAGDVIYLSAGFINADERVVINKKLLIIGAGWEDDPDNGLVATRLNGKAGVIYFEAGSDGSLLYGCRIYGGVDLIRDDSNAQKTQNITIARNYIANGISMNMGEGDNESYGNKNIYILENVISSGVFGAGEECIISNNLFNDGAGVSHLKRSVISNNIIGKIQSSPFCEVKNNYFYNGPIDAKYCVFNNNAFSFNVEVSGANNIVQSLASTFQSNDIFRNPKGCLLKNDSPCKTGGSDGTEIGIFGGISPYKLGNAPFNLHIDRMKIPYITYGKEGLEIDVKVSVQER